MNGKKCKLALLRLPPPANAKFNNPRDFTTHNLVKALARSRRLRNGAFNDVQRNRGNNKIKAVSISFHSASDAVSHRLRSAIIHCLSAELTETTHPTLLCVRSTSRASTPLLAVRIHVSANYSCDYVDSAKCRSATESISALERRNLVPIYLQITDRFTRICVRGEEKQILNILWCMRGAITRPQSQSAAQRPLHDCALNLAATECT